MRGSIDRSCLSFWTPLQQEALCGESIHRVLCRCLYALSIKEEGVYLAQGRLHEKLRRPPIRLRSSYTFPTLLPGGQCPNIFSVRPRPASWRCQCLAIAKILCDVASVDLHRLADAVTLLSPNSSRFEMMVLLSSRSNDRRNIDRTLQSTCPRGIAALTYYGPRASSPMGSKAPSSLDRSL